MRWRRRSERVLACELTTPHPSHRWYVVADVRVYFQCPGRPNLIAEDEE